MAYFNKTEAFEHVAFRYPRGADVGTKVYYLDAQTKQRVEFCVAAEQVWRTETGERVMGLVWSGVCAVCKEGFFQTSPTHPKELNEQCSFCCSQRYDTYNVADIKVFNPSKITNAASGAKYIKRRGRLEQIIIDNFPLFYVDLGLDEDGKPMRGWPEDGVTWTDLVDGVVAQLSPPEEGKRDIRRQTVTRACKTLLREKEGPLRMQNERFFLN